jgi:hypothetical protein
MENVEYSEEKNTCSDGGKHIWVPVNSSTTNRPGGLQKSKIERCAICGQYRER